MAYSEDKWKEAKIAFESGELSFRKISKMVGIDYRTIEKESKKRQWKKGVESAYIQAKELIADKKETFKKETNGDRLIGILDDIAEAKIFARKKANDFNDALYAKANKILEEGYIEERVGLGDGMQGFKLKKIGAKELKELSDMNHTIADIAGILPKAHIDMKADTLNMQQNTQINVSNEYAQMEELALEVAHTVVEKRKKNR